MTNQVKILCAMAVSGFAAFMVTSPAQALTSQECSAKYQAAKTAGTLAGQKWNDFRKAQCGADATAAAPAATPAAAPAKSDATKTETKAPAEKKAEKPRTAASLECSKEADAKGLHGKERKKFRSECRKTAADKAK